MILKQLDIKNFKSLEDVTLDKVDQFNVIIGRNNSGKSSVFAALESLRAVILGEGRDWSTALTHRETDRSWEIAVLFELSSAERTALTGTFEAADPARRTTLLDGPFVRHVHFRFKSSPGDP